MYRRCDLWNHMLTKESPSLDFPQAQFVHSLREDNIKSYIILWRLHGPFIVNKGHLVYRPIRRNKIGSALYWTNKQNSVFVHNLGTEDTAANGARCSTLARPVRPDWCVGITKWILTQWSGFLLSLYKIGLDSTMSSTTLLLEIWREFCKTIEQS